MDDIVTLVLYSTEYVDELMDLMFDHIILDPGPFAFYVG